MKYTQYTNSIYREYMLYSDVRHKIGYCKRNMAYPDRNL